MSTRANIVIKQGARKTYLYHHHDGYMEGLGQALKKYVEGHDVSDPGRTARSLLRGDARVYDDGHNEMERTNGIHADAEYVYTIDSDRGTLSVKRWAFRSNRWSAEREIARRAGTAARGLAGG